ncbi:MAG: adenosylcobinamide-GDP ribazoletransferase [Pseudomonadota bacterium]
MNPLLAALQFLTVLPVNADFSDRDRALSQLWFPAVGFVFGTVLVALSAVNSHTPLVGGALVVLCWAALSGGLHLDGLADSADAWAAGRGDRERALQVMKDPACGPAGVVTVVCILLAKFAAVAALIGQGQIWVLAAAPLLGRTAVLALFASTPYAREKGLGTPYVEQVSRANLLIGAGLGALGAMVFASIVPVLIAAALLYALRALMMRHLNGMTGDTLGASIEVVECGTLLSAALLFA